MGRRCATDEQVPHGRGPGYRQPLVRPGSHRAGRRARTVQEAFTPHCFYCKAHLPADNPIDHVLPWSLVGIDGLANLVLACSRCNTDKRHALPAVEIVTEVLGRDRVVLEQIADEIRWPAEYNRVVSAARGIYASQPPGIATWSGYKSSARLDIAFVPGWIQRTDL